MILIIFAALVGGIAALAVLAPYYGVLIAIACAPVGGSLLAATAAAFLAWRNRDVDVERTTDDMVADLRRMAEAGRLLDSTPAPTRSRDVA